MEGSVPHASARKRCADLAGSVPLGQISDHTAAKDLVAIQQALLRATPGRAGRLAGLLGPILPIRARMAGDLTAHHRGTTPNQVSDPRLGQAHIHPRHDRRTILNSKHPTTAHNQPLQQHCYHTNCLHPMTPPIQNIANANHDPARVKYYLSTRLVQIQHDPVFQTRSPGLPWDLAVFWLICRSTRPYFLTRG